MTTGSPDLDRILGSGLERQIITQIYGEPGSGKSTFAIMAAVAALKTGEGVIFFDTEASLQNGSSRYLVERMPPVNSPPVCISTNQ